MNRHLLEKLELAVDRIHTINVNVCNKLKSKALVTFIFGLIATVLAFVVTLLFYIKSVITYDEGIFLAQRLPPSTFILNKQLHNFIINKKELKEETEMSLSQSVLFMSHDCIVCTNDSGVVEIINPAVTETLGYTPEQMLGQNISAFFINSAAEQTTNDKKDEANQVSQSAAFCGDSEKISNQLELMKNGQIGLVYEDHFTCITDDNQEMPCGVTILGMTNQGNSLLGNENHHDLNVESFVFIIRDETQLMKQQKEAEAAKAQSENLLFQILPRDIVTRLNSGEKDISFTVESASIIFTDIVKFSEYTQGLSPQEIMGSLSTLFAAFDSKAKKYDLITKIKLIGDIYMAAGGLFSDETVPMKAHAEQIVNFGLDCLTELEEVNIKLSSNLQLRIGINSGGPILAGVIGTDKPVFDIIGDPINVASRLQTTDIPGKAQIPKATYDLICDGDFHIEERREVFLKGKGKTMTYLVSPMTNANILVYPSSSIPILYLIFYLNKQTKQ